MDALFNRGHERVLDVQQIRSFLYSGGFRRLSNETEEIMYGGCERWVKNNNTLTYQPTAPVELVVAVIDDKEPTMIRAHDCQTLGQLLGKILKET